MSSAACMIYVNCIWAFIARLEADALPKPDYSFHIVRNFLLPRGRIAHIHPPVDRLPLPRIPDGRILAVRAFLLARQYVAQEPQIASLHGTN